MSEETKTTNTETNINENSTEEVSVENNTLSVDDLMKQLAEANARAEKNKIELDKALKENGTVKKALRAKQTTEEQEAEARAEAQKLADEERESMRKELNHIKAVNAYKAVADEKMVESLIDAVSDADHNAIAGIMEKYASAKVKEAQTEWLKSRPQANAGQYSSMTREQIMSISDRTERMKAIAQNQQLFS